MNKSWIIAAPLLLAVGLGVGYWLAILQQAETQHVTPAPAMSRKPLFYRNPMNPAVTSPVPTKDAMGMDYVPVYADEDADKAPPGTVSIDAVTEQNIGVRTAVADRKRCRTSFARSAGLLTMKSV